MLLQENIATKVNGPSILHNPSGKEAYLSCHIRSFRKCTNTIYSMELHQNYPLLTHHFHPLPTTPPTNNINTHSKLPQPSVNTLGSKSEVPSTPSQQENVQELLPEFENLGKNQYIDYYPPQVINTQEGVETFTLKNPQYLHSVINSLANFSNPSTTMTPYIISTTRISSVLSEHTILLSEYDLDISTYIIQQLGVKW